MNIYHSDKMLINQWKPEKWPSWHSWNSCLASRSCSAILRVVSTITSIKSYKSSFFSSSNTKTVPLYIAADNTEYSPIGNSWYQCYHTSFHIHAHPKSRRFESPDSANLFGNLNAIYTIYTMSNCPYTFLEADIGWDLLTDWQQLVLPRHILWQSWTRMMMLF